MGTHYSHLTNAQRHSIAALRAQGLSSRAIADRMDVHHATISRELIRGKSLEAPSGYDLVLAERIGWRRRRQAGCSRRKLGMAMDTPLAVTVRSMMAGGWSPEQVAGKLQRMADKPTGANAPPSTTAPASMTVSHETIYAAIYAMPRGTLRTELVTLLRQSHKTRMPRSRGAKRSSVIKDMKPISLRPPEVAARIVPGHWEGDLIKGRLNRSAVGTLVERTSRYLMLVKLDGVDAQSVLQGFTRRLRSVPPAIRTSLTYDQGSEMTLHQQLAKNLKIDVYFCDPHSPWQRGSNENANGLIREYLPKGMDLSNVTHQQLTSIEQALNHRPRKILNFESPFEVLNRIKSSDVAGVALHA
jgi:transposase, IS30 family